MPADGDNYPPVGTTVETTGHPSQSTPLAKQEKAFRRIKSFIIFAEENSARWDWGIPRTDRWVKEQARGG